MIDIYTDGGCSGNPGPGGWAFVILSNGEKTTGTGGEKATTNNRMELTAVISALKQVEASGEPQGTALTLSTDSQYVKNGITSWIHNWMKNNWQTAAKKPVKNKDLWVELKKMSDRFNIQWKWVAGHSGHQYNEECDSLVQVEMRKFK